MSQGAANELKAALDCDVLLVDRPIPDALAYLNAALRWRGVGLPAWQANLLLQLARGYALTYDLLMKTVLNATMPLGTAKKRDDDLAFRAMVAEEMDGIFSQLENGYESLTVENAGSHLDVSIASVLRHLEANTLPETRSNRAHLQALEQR